MSQELIKSLITWGPTLLFLVILGFYFLVGVLRGLRKSVILLIHATASMVVCIIIFFSIVNSENIDQTMVSLVNYILNMFGTSIQNIIGVSEELTTVKDMLLDIIVTNMSEQELFYHIIVDSGVYISAVLDCLYRIVLFIVLGILHFILVFILNIIYHIFYPVRRKVRCQKKAFENGDASEPYKKRRLMGGLIGVLRGCISSVFGLSFLGALLFVVTGENKPLPDRNAGTSEEIVIINELGSTIYDYYGYVCEMSDTGIFKVLNGIKDKDNVPYYFYICDVILQGSIVDKEAEIDETYYVRKGLGNYFALVKDSLSLVIKYAGNDLSDIVNNGGDAVMPILTELLQDERFISELNGIIDEFEAKCLVGDFVLFAMTSLVNNIDSVLGEDSKVTKLFQHVFNPEDGIKITDLATEEDIKGMFKASLSLVSQALIDMNTEKKMRQSLNAFDLQSFDIKIAFKYAKVLIDQVQSLSLFNDRKDVGNKLFKNLYKFCAEELIEDSSDLPEIPAGSWVDELNVLFDSLESLLSIASVIYANDMNAMIANAFNMFEGENGAAVEQDFDKFISQLSKSNLLDVVFRSFVPGKALDGILQNLTSNVEATMPKKFTIASSGDEPGELEIVLTVLKDFIKNDGASIYELVTDGKIDENDLRKIFELLDKDLNEDPNIEEKLVDKLLQSKALRYFLSAFVTYINLGDIKLYITDSAAEKVEEIVTVVDEEGNESEVNKIYNVIKKEELSVLFDFAFSSTDFVIDLLGGGDINVLDIVTSDEVVDLMKKSNLLKGIIASVFISFTADIDLIVMPYGFDDPERWIQEKEVDAIVDTIINLKEEKTESGESLISSLMGGNVDIGVILDLSDNVIHELYKSKVLKYTVSNALTGFTDSSFKIVVPAVACEIKQAPTTVPGKMINIVSADEIINIFNQVNNIVEINGSEVNVLYSKIFNNKDEILESYTIQATIMNLLIEMGSDPESIIGVPEELISEFDEFIDAETIEKVETNRWFYSDNITLLPTDKKVLDDELYLLFNAIEALLGDEYKTTDDEGNEIISDNFSIDNIGSSINIKRDSIDTITASLILNGTLTDTISLNFATPLSALEHGVIKKEELSSLLNSLFVVLDKRKDSDVITLEEVEGIDVNTIKVVRSDFDMYHKKSSVFMTAFSSMLSEIENVYIPVDATEPIDAIHNKENVVVNRIIDETINNDLDNNEFDHMLDCLFEFLGKMEDDPFNKDENDVPLKREILNLENFENVETDFKITADRIDTISKSKVFSASLSVILCEDDTLIVPIYDENGDAVAEQKAMINQEDEKYVLTQSELKNTLESLLEMFGEDNNGVKELGLTIDLTNFIVSEPVIDKIINSAVLSATISDYIVDKNIAVIPNIDTVIEQIEIIQNESIVNSFKVTQNELEGFMLTALGLFGKDNQETNEKELNINNIKVDELVITNSDEVVDECIVCKNTIHGNTHLLGHSIIMNSTTVKEIAKVDSLIIPLEDENGIVAEIHESTKEGYSCAVLEDVVSFMNDIVDFFGGTIKPKELGDSEFTLKTNEDLDGALWATFAKQLINNNSILIPDEDTVEKYNVLNYVESDGTFPETVYLVTQAETNLFKNSVIRVLSENNQTFNVNLKEGVKTNEMSFEANDASEGKVFDSRIFTATVAKSILDLKNTLTVPEVVKVNEMFYGNYQPVTTLRKDQVEALFNSLFITTNYQPIKINYFKTEDMTLPTDKEKISEMLDSLIVSATISNEIVNSSVVVLDDVMSPYIYNSIIGEELFINDSELANLVHALTFGFGITDINGLSYDGLAIPNNNTSDYNDKIAVISNSALIRASITKEIVRNDDENSAKKAISIEDNTDVCGIYTEYKSLNRVVVVTSNEIVNLINGVNVLNGSNDNGYFSNISVNISELMGSSTDAHDKRSAVINSSILRSILSNTLTESTITGVPYYVYLNQLSVLNPNYVPMEPTLNVKVYKSFVVVEGEVADLFSASELEKLEFAITN